jgi:hypothetical protein
MRPMKTRQVVQFLSPTGIPKQWRRTLCLLLVVVLLAPFAVAGNGNGNGNGGGGGGGGGPPGGGDDGGGTGGGPADPAIAFVGNGSLAVMNEDGSNVTNLGLGADHPDWSPDLDGDPSNGYQGALAFELYLANGTTDVHLADIRVVAGLPTAVRLRRLPVPMSYEASWSPDIDPTQAGYQGRIAFTDETGVGSVDVNWDGVINGVDLALVSAARGMNDERANLILSGDVDGDGDIDDDDVALISERYWTSPGKASR